MGRSFGSLFTLTSLFIHKFLKISFTKQFSKTRAYQVSFYWCPFFFCLFHCHHDMLGYFQFSVRLKKQKKKWTLKGKWSSWNMNCKVNWMGRLTSSATIEERHKLHKKFLGDYDQLMTEVNINFIKYEFIKCSSKLIIKFI